jgi:hypothetical protein
MHHMSFTSADRQTSVCFKLNWQNHFFRAVAGHPEMMIFTLKNGSHLAENEKLDRF